MITCLPLYALCYKNHVFDGLKSIVMEEHELVDDFENSCGVTTEEGILSLSRSSSTDIVGEVIALSVSAMEPPLVGSAWNILIEIFVQLPGSVWLSTYSRTHLEQFGRVKEAEVNGVPGFLLDADAFDKMIS